MSAFPRAVASQLPKQLFGAQTRFASSHGPLRRTPLYELNVARGGKMVEFGGWEMPVIYAGAEGGIVHTHLHTRKSAGLFDVSHMVPVRIHGKDRAAFMEKVVVGDIKDLPSNMGTLSLIPNAKGLLCFLMSQCPPPIPPVLYLDGILRPLGGLYLDGKINFLQPKSKYVSQSCSQLVHRERSAS